MHLAQILLPPHRQDPGAAPAPVRPDGEGGPGGAVPLRRPPHPVLLARPPRPPPRHRAAPVTGVPPWGFPEICPDWSGGEQNKYPSHFFQRFSTSIWRGFFPLCKSSFLTPRPNVHQAQRLVCSLFSLRFFFGWSCFGIFRHRGFFVQRLLCGRASVVGWLPT